MKKKPLISWHLYTVAYIVRFDLRTSVVRKKPEIGRRHR